LEFSFIHPKNKFGKILGKSREILGKIIEKSGQNLEKIL
jgi:hypothetical protein